MLGKAKGFTAAVLGTEGIGLGLGDSGAVGCTGNGFMDGLEFARSGAWGSGGNGLREGNATSASGGFIIGTPFVPVSKAPSKLVLSKLALVR